MTFVPSFSDMITMAGYHLQDDTKGTFVVYDRHCNPKVIGSLYDCERWAIENGVIKTQNPTTNVIDVAYEVL